MQTHCVIAGVEGFLLTKEESALLKHPLIDGVILFKRNIDNYQQLCQLTASIKALRQPALTIYVDQEGGRVQRLQCEPFTRLPSMREIANVYLEDSVKGLAYAKQMGRLMASEVLKCGIDISFAPVLDLDRGLNEVIGCRSFGKDPIQVAACAGAFILGMFDAGMRCAVGKHFPGHGGVALDSHLDVPVDDRSYEQLEAQDIEPFRILIARGLLTGIMPAHIIYPAIDAKHCAGFSPIWLQEILRQKMKFKGTIISDDLCMEGARCAGDIKARASTALNAGCDKVLVCQGLSNVRAVVEHLAIGNSPPLKKGVTSEASRGI